MSHLFRCVAILAQARTTYWRLRAEPQQLIDSDLIFVPTPDYYKKI